MPVVREGHVDAVLGGVEGDALEFGAAEIDLLAGEVLEEVLAGFGAAAGLADDLDDVVEVVERDLVAEEDVLAVAGLAEEEGGAAADDFDAVIEEGADGVRRAGAPWADRCGRPGRSWRRTPASGCACGAG